MRNPAPVDRWFISLFIGFQPSFWWFIGFRWPIHSYNNHPPRTKNNFFWLALVRKKIQPSTIHSLLHLYIFVPWQTIPCFEHLDVHPTNRKWILQPYQWGYPINQWLKTMVINQASWLGCTPKSHLTTAG